MDPTREEKRQAHRRAMKLMKSIGVSDKVKLTEYELCIASDLVDPLGMVVSWENIGGLEGTINEILETVILPFHDNAFVSDSSLVQPPKGVLLYGPPGCGKTMIAKATAKAAGARFVNLQVSTLVDKWYGESQKRVEAVFSLAVKLQPTIIFIDEIDSFMRTRNSTDHEATAMMKTQFMSFWDGLVTDSRCRVMIMGATNRPQDVDAAILRRMPSMFHVGLPELQSREQILNLILGNEPVKEDVSINKLAVRTQGYSGSDLRELCRNAAIYRLREYSKRRRLAKMKDSNTGDDLEDANSLRHISVEDFERAFIKMKQSKFLSPMSVRFIDVE
ncbi:ATPase family AAA domain-containing protein 1 [Lamellibrachia satsuma]|nr:ATPase family AAA domain-containing protein 1 [Lamellibrachia satsuma]